MTYPLPNLVDKSSSYSSWSYWFPSAATTNPEEITRIHEGEAFKSQVGKYADNCQNPETKRILNKFLQSASAHALSLAQKISGTEKLTKESERLLIEICTIPASKREAVLELATPSLETCLDTYRKAELLKALKPIALKTGAHIIQAAQPLLAQCKGDRYKVDLLNAVKYFIEKGPDGVFELVNQLIEGSFHEYHQIAFINIIKQIPEEKLFAVLKLSAPLLKQQTDYEKKDLLEAIKEISKDEEGVAILVQIKNLSFVGKKCLNAIKDISPIHRSVTLELATPFLDNRRQTDDTQAELLHAIHKIVRGQNTNILELAKPIWEKYPYLNKAHLLNALNNIPNNEQDLVLRLTSLVEGSQQTDDREIFYIDRLIAVINKIPKEERENVVRIATPLLEHYKTNTHKAALLKAIRNIPQELREEIVRLATPLLNNCIEDRFKEQLLTAIYSLSPSERNAIVEFATPFLNACTSITSKIKLLEAIKDILPHERAAILEIATPLFGKENEADVVRAILGIAPDQRKTVIAASPPLLTTCKDQHKAARLTAITSVAPDQRDEVITLMTSCLEMETGDANKQELHDTIMRISHDQRTDVMTHALPLLKACADYQRRMSLLNAITEIPHDQRNATIRLALTLCSPDDVDFPSVLKALGSTPKNEQASSMQLAQPLFTQYNNHKSDLLVALSRAPYGERKAIVELVTPFLNKCENQYKTALLNAIIDVPHNQRKTLIELATPTLKKCTNDAHKADLITTLTQILPEERAEVLKLLFEIFQQCSFDVSAIDLLKVMKDTPREERGAIMELSLSIFTKHPYAASKDALFNAIKELPKEERASIVQLVISFFPDSNSNQFNADILKAIHAIPKDVRRAVLQLAVPCLKNRYFSSINEDLLWILRDLSEKERVAFIELVTPDLSKYYDVETLGTCSTLFSFLSKRTREQKMAYMQHIVATPQDERIEVINRLTFKLPPIVQTKSDTEAAIELMHHLATLLGKIGGDNQDLVSDMAQFDLYVTNRIRVPLSDELKDQECILIETLISVIFKALQSKMQFSQRENGLYIPYCTELTQELKTTHQKIGKFLMSCRYIQIPNNQIVIEKPLDDSVYIAMTVLQKHDHLIDCSDPTLFTEFFALYKQMNDHDEASKKIIHHIETFLNITESSDAATLFAFQETLQRNGIEEANCTDVDQIRKALADLKDSYKRLIIEQILTPQIAPLIEMTRGVRESFIMLP